MNASLEINLDTVTPLRDIQASDSTAAPDTVAAIEVAATEYPAPAHQDNGNNELIAWGGVALSLCVGVVAWKLIGNLKKEVMTLRHFCSASKEIQDNLQIENKELRARIDNLNRNVESIMQNARTRVAEQKVAASREYQPPRPPAPTREVKTIRYDTLQSPGASGELRFAERSMSEQPSPQKMFLLELDISKGTGTYRVNPAAARYILSNLQMFSAFVKPFTFYGNTLNASIQDIEAGKIVKRGAFWIVEEPLEISLK